MEAEFTPSAMGPVKRLSGGLRRLATLERNLGALLVLTPLLLICVDTGPKVVRSSISAYYDVGEPEAFYVPLTAGVMLFLVNGLVKNANGYNVALGLALLGVILFDHESMEVLHFICAGGFFAGNFAIMLFFSKRKSMRIRIMLGAAIVVAIALLPLTSLFWTEWVSLAVVATHFILDSLGSSPYEALGRGESPTLKPAPLLS